MVMMKAVTVIILEPVVVVVELDELLLDELSNPKVQVVPLQ